MQNAVKHLSCRKDKDKDKDKENEEDKEKEESNILADFSACMFEYEELENFEEAFHTMRTKVEKQTWFDSIYKVKEKWVVCYMKDAFTLGMRSTQLSESLNNDLKHHLKSDLDVIRFFKHFERVVQGKRDIELSSEYESRELVPRVKMRTPMLVQASQVYTPVIFECFQKEYERSIAACTKQLNVEYEFAVTISTPFEAPTFEKECKVIANPLEQTTFCSCGQFERIGILYAHALRILDLMNIKLLPAHYILKRWTREARSGTVQDRSGRNVVENPMLAAVLRYKYLSHKFVNLATPASRSEECCVLLDDALDSVGKVIAAKLQLGNESNPDKGCDTQVIAEKSNENLAAARLKKKSPRKKTKKRKLSWLDKFHKGKKKKELAEVVKAQELTKQQESGSTNTQNQNNNSQGSGFRSFTDLLTASSIEDIGAEYIF